MSLLPVEELTLHVRYEILDTPDLGLSPLGELLHYAHDPTRTASLTLRDPESPETLSVEIAEITHAPEHDRTKGGVFFEGRLKDGRAVQGYVFAQPQDPEKPDVLGSLIIRP